MVSNQLKNLKKIRLLCAYIMKDQKNINNVEKLKEVIVNSTPNFLKIVESTILSTFYGILINISENKLNYPIKEKEVIINTLKELFSKIVVDKEKLFFNFYGFLLFQIYDSKQHIVLKLPEEYTLSIVECTTSLARSLSLNLVIELYNKENVPKFCQMLYVLLQITKNEQHRLLRIASINCIMAIARVQNDDDFNDVEMRNQISEMFMFFLPGMASQLKNIILEDEKIGHKIPAIALKAWGRIVTLLMQDYNAYDQRFTIEDIQSLTLNDNETGILKNDQDMNEFIKNSKRSKLWYKNTDKKLQRIILGYSKLTLHSHQIVRLELANMSTLILENCATTMPTSISKLVEILITLSEDENEKVSKISKTILIKLSKKFTTDEFNNLLQQLEEGFFNVITTLPTRFNSIDEREHLVALNLLTGYLNLFGNNNLNQILHSVTHLNRLIQSLIHVTELEKKNVRLLEECTVPDLDFNQSITKYPWKKFHHFKNDSVRERLEIVCSLLAYYGSARIISDFLLDIYLNDFEHKKEATFILNELITGMSDISEENLQIIRNIFSIYTEHNNWNLPLNVMIDEFGYEHNLGDVQNHIIQVCLQVEGIGKMASTLKEKFQEFLLKSLYMVLERAGSCQPLIHAAGLNALTNITKSCGYSDISQLINKNIDYFCFYAERKLNKSLLDDQSLLNVLTIVIKFSTTDVLQSIAKLVEEVLMLSCDKYNEKNANSYLQIFKMFIECWWRWLNIEITIEPLKTKQEKEAEIQPFYVSGINRTENISEEFTKKSAKEIYEEDMKKSQKELENEINEPEIDDYKKPEPPLEIKLTVAILNRSLHFLPSKDRARKLLVLEILKYGVEIIKDWEDELLPIVHKIWSPLTGRFKEFHDPLIINYSFQLLITLARLSKDFIRSRTAKDVLLSILEALKKFSDQSYLKDKGSAYRYSQGYKLQLTVLDKLARLLIDIDVLDEHFNSTMDCVFEYLSKKQPISLQKLAIEFFKTLAYYNPKLVKEKSISLERDTIPSEYKDNWDNYIKKLFEN